MQYLCLIYSNESTDPKPGSAGWDELIAEYGAFGDEAASRGVMVGGNALQGIATATTVRVRDGKTETVDGPFAETKEQLGGYYLIEAENLDQALSLAAKIPAARHGCVEVRPIMRLPDRA